VAGVIVVIRAACGAVTVVGSNMTALCLAAESAEGRANQQPTNISACSSAAYKHESWTVYCILGYSAVCSHWSRLIFQRRVLPASRAMMTEKVRTSGMMVYFYETTRHYILEGCLFHTRRRGNLKFRYVVHYRELIQEVLGRTNSPTFPTQVTYLKYLNLI
jgi:hypothetical protein